MTSTKFTLFGNWNNSQKKLLEIYKAATKGRSKFVPQFRGLPTPTNKTVGLATRYLLALSLWPESPNLSKNYKAKQKFDSKIFLPFPTKVTFIGIFNHEYVSPKAGTLPSGTLPFSTLDR